MKDKKIEYLRLSQKELERTNIAQDKIKEILETLMFENGHHLDEEINVFVSTYIEERVDCNPSEKNWIRTKIYFFKEYQSKSPLDTHREKQINKRNEDIINI